MARREGMEKLADTVTVICQKYLGLGHYVDESDDYPCDELLEYIMGKGNFGRKSGLEGRTASVFLDSVNPVRAFKRLHRGGMSRWKAAQKHRILRPFAWIYQVGSITRRLIRGKMTPSKVARQHTEGRRQRELIYKLGLDVERTIERTGDD